MINYLITPYISSSHIANLLHYTTFRAFLAFIFSFGLTVFIGSHLIKKLKQIQKDGQPIRDDGPKSHLKKAGTPTMGGLMILISVLVTSLVFCDITNLFVISVLFVMLSYGFLGFLDDYNKLKFQSHKGVSARFKLVLQLLFALPACLLVYFYTDNSVNSSINFPIFKNLILDLGYFYIFFAAFVIVGTSNAVNLTDGLDGLAIFPISVVASVFAVISYCVGDLYLSNYFYTPHIEGASELLIVCASLIGAGLGFLWYNAKPAEVFMGDTGSLSLGATLGMLSVITKQEIILAISGLIFVVETLSVIIQVYYFRATGGKRFFRMAPIHHHFEQQGLSETKVVARFWIVSIILAVISLSLFKIR